MRTTVREKIFLYYYCMFFPAISAYFYTGFSIQTSHLNELEKKKAPENTGHSEVRRAHPFLIAASFTAPAIAAVTLRSRILGRIRSFAGFLM